MVEAGVSFRVKGLGFYQLNLGTLGCAHLLSIIVGHSGFCNLYVDLEGICQVHAC